MTLQRVQKKTIVIDILANILRSKGNQTRKPGQLIEYNMRKIFFENHTQNVVQPSPRLFPF